MPTRCTSVSARGMAALNVVASSALYGGTYTLLNVTLRRLGDLPRGYLIALGAVTVLATVANLAGRTRRERRRTCTSARVAPLPAIMGPGQLPEVGLVRSYTVRPPTVVAE